MDRLGVKDMRDFWHRFSIWFEVGFIIITLLLFLIDGFSIEYVVTLLGEVVILLLDFWEKKSRKS